MKSISVTAPSNIALIKYMGKKEMAHVLSDEQKNIATNSSLSLTLNRLLTRVDLIEKASGPDEWQPLNFILNNDNQENQWQPLLLNAKSQERFLNHFQFLKKKLNISGNYLVLSANNFPSDCGLASSASSFAALTKAAGELARNYYGQEINIDELAELSRKGSGSSIRSFYSPYSVWQNEKAYALKNVNLELYHQVIVVEDTKKEVSSSEAHKRVLSSPLFEGRVERAEKRLVDLIAVFEKYQAGHSAAWTDAYRIVWSEFHDMHSLFSTAQPPFSYWCAGTDKVLDWVSKLWLEKGDGPLVTMDAGANVHILTRRDQIELRQKIREQFSNFIVYGDM